MGHRFERFASDGGDGCCRGYFLKKFTTLHKTSRGLEFYGTLALRVFRDLAEASRGRGIADGLDPEVFAAAPEMIAVSFDATPYLDRKFSALAAHRSAFGVTLEMLKDPPPAVAPMLRAFRPVMEREAFLLGGARGVLPRWPLPDFFDGLGSATLNSTVDAGAASHVQ